MSKKRKIKIKQYIEENFPDITFYDKSHIIKASLAPHLKLLPASIATWLSTIAHIRHHYTDYEMLLQQGYEKDSARYFSQQQINRILKSWNAKKLLT